MIKVLLVVCNNVLNGSERYTVDLAGNLSPDKFDITIATPMKGPLSAILSNRNIKEFIYDNGKIEYYTFHGLKKLYKFIKKNKIQIVHANAKFQPNLIAKLAGAKLTIETKHGIFYTASQLENLPKLRILYEHIKQYFVDRFIVICENDKKNIIKYFKIKEEKISVIYNGLDFNKLIGFKAANSNKTVNNNGSQILLGNIGRLTFQKGQEILLEAFKMLYDKYKGIRLELIGDGENKNMLQEYIDENQLNEVVTFKGYVDNIYEEISTFDALVLTSRFEGTPYVIFEAMALGVPVITTDVGGISNILKNEYDALITSPDEPVQTFNAIEKLITDIDLRKRLTQNALVTVRKYDVEKMAINTANLYLSKTGSF